MLRRGYFHLPPTFLFLLLFYSCSSQTWNCLSSTDYNGGDISAIYAQTAATLAACKLICSGYSGGCYAITYFAGQTSGNCYPKKSTGWTIKTDSSAQTCILGILASSPSVSPTRTPTSSSTPSFSATPSITKSFSGTSTLSPTSSPTRTTTPTTTGTPSTTTTLTRSATSSPTPTPSMSGTPSLSATSTPTLTPTKTNTGTPSVTNTPTSSSTLSVTPTSSLTSTITPTSSSTSSVTPTSSFTSTGTSTPSTTSTVTPTSSSSSSATSTPPPTSTVTPTSSPTSSATSTPSSSPPPRSCLFRTEGCSTPTLLFHPPLFSSGIFFPPPLPPLPIVSYPYLSTPFNVSLPLPPSQGETVAVTCSITGGSGPAQVGVVSDSPTGGGPGGEARVPAASWGASFVLLGLPPVPTAVAPPGSSTPSLQCLVTSTPVTTGQATLPRYGKTTLLTSPVVAAPSSPPPTIAVILAESVAAAGGGVFRGLGGVIGGQWALTPISGALLLPLNGTASGSSGSRGGTNASVGAGTVPWDSPLIPTLPAAMTAVSALRDSLLSSVPTSSPMVSSPPPPFIATISGTTHLLLLSPPTQPFPSSPPLVVFLGGFPCTTNWVSPDATIASVTTPPGMGDFGIAPLCLWGGGGPSYLHPLLRKYSSDILLPSSPLSAPLNSSPPSSLPSLPPLSFPSLYPPLMPLGQGASTPPPQQGNTSGAVALLSPFAGVLNATVLAAVAVAATLPPNTFGIRVVEACSGNPFFAPPEDCVVVNGTLQPYLNSSSLMSCAWGSGDSCQPCPVGALCPGGEVLIPTPGYWVPTLSSPITDFTACPQPAATQRCPALGSGGGALQLASGYSNCGMGYRGRACAVCDSGFYTAPDDTCARCPGISATLGILLPFLYLTLGLGGLGCVLVGVLHRVLVGRWRKGGWGGGGRQGVITAAAGAGGAAVGGGEGKPPPTPPTLTNTAASVGQLLLWLWVAAQSSASLFSQARNIAPRALYSLYGILAALQMHGVTLDPACFTSQPFLGFWVCLGATALGLFLLFLCTLCVTALEAPAHGRPWGKGVGVMKGLLLLTATALTAGYGAIISVYADVLTCTLPAPLPLYDYVVAVSDGTALTAAAAALGAPPPSLPSLRAAAANPFLSATNSQLYAFMQATSIPVSVQASNPFQVCKEGPHYAAWWAALAMSLVFTLGYPALGWVCLVHSRAPPAAAVVAALPPPSPTFFRRAVAHLSFHLSDSTYRPQAQGLLYVGQGGLALVTGLVGLSRRWGGGAVCPTSVQGRGA